MKECFMSEKSDKEKFWQTLREPVKHRCNNCKHQQSAIPPESGWMVPMYCEKYETPETALKDLPSSRKVTECIKPDYEKQTQEYAEWEWDGKSN